MAKVISQRRGTELRVHPGQLMSDNHESLFKASFYFGHFQFLHKEVKSNLKLNKLRYEAL